jgi:hypothetical protein
MADREIITSIDCRAEDIFNPDSGGPLPPAPDLPQPTPEEALLLDASFANHEALKRLGWRDIMYCPKDGTMFLAIEPGSAGVHNCNYTGSWPDGSWWIYDGDMWPAHPILFKAIPG